MERRISVRGVAVHNGKLLCVRLKQYKGALKVASETPWWCTPGGGLDAGESLTDGIMREMLEETGITPKVGRLLYVQQFTSQGRDQEYLEFFFHIENAEDYLNIDLTKTTHGDTEIAEIAFVDPKTTNILPKFFTTEDLPTFIANNHPVKFFTFYG